MDDRLRRLQQQVLSSPGDPDARARLRAELSRLADLAEHRAWAEADRPAQDVVIAAVDTLLGAAYTHAGTRVFTAGGQTHRVATFVHGATGTALQLIPGGTFVMGSERRDHERPPHEVRVAPILIGRFPLLQAEWDRLPGSDERTFREPDLPIEGVSWQEAQAWLERAGDGLRFPSEAEWEFCCRAGTTSEFFWGDAMEPDHCWFGEQTHLGPRTRPPQAHAEKANAFGLVDMAGNVAEWCADVYVATYRGAPVDGAPRRTRFGRTRVVRGGDSFNAASHCRSAHRGVSRATDRGAGIGLRVTRSVPLFEGSA